MKKPLPEGLCVVVWIPLGNYTSVTIPLFKKNDSTSQECHYIVPYIHPAKIRKIVKYVFPSKELQHLI